MAEKKKEEYGKSIKAYNNKLVSKYEYSPLSRLTFFVGSWLKVFLLC